MRHEILQCSSSKFTKLLKGHTTGVLVMLMREEQNSCCCGWTTNMSVLDLFTFSPNSSHSVRLSSRITVCCPLAAAARTKKTTKHCISTLHFETSQRGKSREKSPRLQEATPLQNSFFFCSAENHWSQPRSISHSKVLGSQSMLVQSRQSRVSAEMLARVISCTFHLICPCNSCHASGLYV